LNNAVVLLEFLLRKVRLVFFDMIFSILIFFKQSFKNQSAIEYLRKFILLPC